MDAGIVWTVASRTPWWVYALFAFLLVLGVRRLKPRRNPLAVAALAPGGFLAWSAAAAMALAGRDSGTLVAAIWGGGFVLGALSAPIRLVPRPVRVSGHAFLFAASAVPLVAYMLIFWTRYGLEVWAAFTPELARRLAFVGLAVSSLTAGRTVGDFLPLLRQVIGAPPPPAASPAGSPAP